MSGLSKIEMSSFGSCSVGSRTQDERGADGPEREGAGPDFGVEAGERGSVDARGGGGAAGGDAAAFSADAAEVRDRGRRGRRSRSARAGVEPVAAGRGSGAGDGRRERSAVPGLRPDAVCRAPGADLRCACERGDAAELDARGWCVGAAGGAGGAGPVGQLGAPMAGRPGGGVRADLDPRRRDEPPDDDAVRRARRRSGRTGRRLSGICAATAAPWPSTPTMPGTSDSGCRGRRSGRTRSSRGGSTCWASR